MKKIQIMQHFGIFVTIPDVVVFLKLYTYIYLSICLSITQKCVDTSDQESANDLEATAEPNKDLISFEEEAELIPSGSALNEAHSDSVVVHSVVRIFSLL